VTISFARGAPSADLLPIEELADCARVALERDGKTVLAYGSGGGYGPLRDWLAERHGVEPERVLITNGSLQAFVFLVEHLSAADGPARILVEAPTYDRPLKVLARLGAEIVTIPLDDDGLDLDALEHELRTGPRPALLYTIPTFQNPSGRTLGGERRRRLAELAGEYELLVLEDDPYGLVRFEGEGEPTIFELEGGRRVAFSSSFSKTVAPGVRVGYVVLPTSLAQAITELAVSTYISPVLPTQAAVWEFIRRGSFEPNLSRVCGLLRERRDAMLAGLDRDFPPGTMWSRPQGGYFVWVDLPDGTDAAGLCERAAEAGVSFVKGADFFPDGSGGSSARLAYSAEPPARIDEGLARLASLLPEPARA